MNAIAHTALSTWGINPVNQDGLVCIAGPCAAESERQVMEAAIAMKSIGVSAFRAGVWKPRTRPGSFEGAGEIALSWLAKAKAETGLKLATETATAKHAEAALNAGVDILWIGARSSANPFAVQEIANALAGVDVPVFVKNPLSPDQNLWIGAIERLLSAGITKVGAILRGFSTFIPSDLRNDPGWQIAIDMKGKFPQMPMLCDPSHIAGRRDKIPTLAQQALNLDFDGLMLEAHCNPAAALSDAKQQLTPEALQSILGSLQVRRRGTPGDCDVRMAAMRAQIDELDSELLSAVARRMQVVTELGKLKRDQNLTVLQSDRWNQVLDAMLKRGQQLGLNASLVETIAKLLHQEAITAQQKILQDKESS